MLGRFKSAIYNAIGGVDVDGVTVADVRPVSGGGRIPGKGPDSPHNGGPSSTGNRVKYAYQRPIFLQVKSSVCTLVGWFRFRLFLLNKWKLTIKLLLFKFPNF